MVTMLNGESQYEINKHHMNQRPRSILQPLDLHYHCYAYNAAVNNKLQQSKCGYLSTGQTILLEHGFIEW